MKKSLTFLTLLTALICQFKLQAQLTCNSSGDLVIFSNYDGGTLTINVDQNIPNLKIGVCSYEGVAIFLTGTFVNNVVAVRYAGYNGSNNHCGQSINTSITGAPSSATTSIVIMPAVTVPNPNGYNTIICAYNCNNGASQGGCNTVDQVEGYFLNHFSGSTLLSHKVQYGCWTGTQSVSVGGTCCPPIPVIPGGVTASQTICAGQVPSAFSSTLAASGGSGTITYSWQSSSSATSGFTNISGANALTFAPGALSTTTYYRRAASTATNNISYSNIVAVTVNPPPSLSISGGSGICPGGSLTLVANGAASYTWMPGTVMANQINVTTSSLGTYTLTGVSAAGCTATAVKQVSLHLLPVITVAGPSSVCPGSVATLFASGAVSYVWSPGNLSGTNVNVSPVIATAYAVTGTDANGCVNTGNYQIGVYTVPSVTVNPPGGMACKNQSVVLTASGANSYTWLPGNIITSQLTLFNPTVSVSYTVNGKDQNNCIGSTMYSLTVNQLPAISISVATQPVCSGKPTLLIGGGALTYTWNPGNIQGDSITLSPASSINYSVTGHDGACKNTATVGLQVLPSPSVSIVSPRLRICTGEAAKLTASGATTYSWVTGGNVITSTISVSPASTMDYTVVGTSANNCQDDASITVSVAACTGVAEKPVIDDGILIFPNPSHDKVTISAKTGVILDLVSINGQIVRSLTLDQKNSYTVEVSDLAAGTYLLKDRQGRLLKQKIVITH